jgi:hypothetical protein
MCFVWISEKTAIISVYNINWLVCITETECVYCAVRNESLNTIRLNSNVQGAKMPHTKPWPTAVAISIIYQSLQSHICPAVFSPFQRLRRLQAGRGFLVPFCINLRLSDADKGQQRLWFFIFFVFTLFLLTENFCLIHIQLMMRHVVLSSIITLLPLCDDHVL